ncbi:hypothetical protein OPV22_002626 [Ensete ventricosum]|uniref:RING-type domain-containing protein n=1 Tax=Ensete ventricosum TaxID=4639 RepID=A0AAV8RYC9_ENSVE|nr:hypothetical protein OPV22_002626 [Ensete ventricosum]
MGILSPNLIIIAAIIAFVIVASFSIHLLVRFLSCRRRSSSTVTALPLSLTRSRSASGSSGAADDSALSDRENAVLIDSLPVFTLAFALASLPMSSPDCAVCLCPFSPHDELRLLPACRHAFHSSCVEPWLRTTPSCPLCRASIALPHPAPSAAAVIGCAASPPLIGIPRDPAALGSGLAASATGGLPRGKNRGTTSHRCHRPTRLRGRRGRRWQKRRGGGRRWLKEYVDRLASSSFSSLHFSGRWSRRYDADGGGAVGRHSWDLEGSARREAEEGGYYAFYRWLIGA